MILIFEADRRLWKSSAGISTNLIPMSKTTFGTYHYPAIQVVAERLFQRSLSDHCVDRSLPVGKVAFLMEKVMAYKIRWLAVSQTYLSALFSCQRTATACQPVKANSRTIDFYRMTSGVAGKGRKPRPPVCI